MIATIVNVGVPARYSFVAKLRRAVWVIAYVEADYFGGKVGQACIIWSDGKRIVQLKYGQDVIKAVLRHFGVVAEKGRDEFETLGFGHHRNSADWIED